MKISKIKIFGSITIVLFSLGFMLSIQYRAQNTSAGDLSMQRTENLIAMVRDLSDKRQRLNFEINDLYKKLTTQTTSYENMEEKKANLEEELIKLRIANGTIPVQGPGLTVTIDEYMPVLYVDIIYLVNELWAAGAEAIAINDQRINANSSIFYMESDDGSGMYITVNDKKLEYPIVIKAIGNPNNLEKGLTIPGGIMDNLALFRAYPRLEQSESLTVPALELPNLFIFMEEYEAPPADNTTANNKTT